MHSGFIQAFYSIQVSVGLVWIDGDLCVGLDWISLGCHCPLSNVPGCLLRTSWSWIPSGSGLEFCLLSPSLPSHASVLCLLNKFSTSVGFLTSAFSSPTFSANSFLVGKATCCSEKELKMKFPFVVQNQFPYLPQIRHLPVVPQGNCLSAVPSL